MRGKEGICLLLEIIAASMFPDWPRHWDGDLPMATVENRKIDDMTREHMAGVTIEAGSDEQSE